MLDKQKYEQVLFEKTVEIEQPKKKEMWAYAFGSFGIFSVWTLIGAFLTFYYTDVAGLAAGTVGTLMLLARLFDGITDLGMGTLVDRTKSKYGKARPWLLWMSIPLGVTTVLLFSVPNISMSGKVVYAYVTYILFILLYTAVSIPYKTLLGVMTQHQHSRSLSNIYSAIFIMTGTMIVMTLTQPLAASFGWSTLAALFAVVTVVALYITFRSVKERTTTSSTKEAKLGVKEGFRNLFKNKYWVIITAFCVTFYATIGLTQGAGIYYAAWILGDISYYPLIGLAISAPMLIGLLFLGPFVAKYGKRNVVIIGASVAIIGQVIKWMNPTDLTTFLIGTVLAALGAMPAIALIFAMINDTIEYGEYKTGLRTEGLVNSGASFGIKVGTGIGLALIGWLLGVGGYIGGGATEQSDLAIQMILALNIAIPLVLTIVQLLLLLLFKMDKEYPMILAELQKRKGLIK